MTAEKYENMLKSVEEKRLVGIIKTSSRLATLTVYILYPSVLVFLMLTKSPNLVKTVLVPMISFLAVSFARKLINRQRPYEKFCVAPLSERKRTGLSMPSRHTFSAFVIGTVTLFVIPVIGIVSATCGVIIAVSRILLGLHYPSDVAVGALIGIVFGLTVLFF